MEAIHENLPVSEVPVSFELANALLGTGEVQECKVGFHDSGRPEVVEFRVVSIERHTDYDWPLRVIAEILSSGIFDWESAASRLVLDCKPGETGVCAITDWPEAEDWR